ncbi:hypothetical protein B0T14DRAFT_273790 [Immersiella caudata]|uniref:Uncharacterized protein n=1 Tax=Immersiella caudata TaxID=314043 RepID=A0AA40BXU6_9PEZI|nr:hypothetical protein B0T14DRAFT_273790 [Immersiella caudata]
MGHPFVPSTNPSASPVGGYVHQQPQPQPMAQVESVSPSLNMGTSTQQWQQGYTDGASGGDAQAGGYSHSATLFPSGSGYAGGYPQTRTGELPTVRGDGELRELPTRR